MNTVFFYKSVIIHYTSGWLSSYITKIYDFIIIFLELVSDLVLTCNVRVPCTRWFLRYSIVVFAFTRYLMTIAESRKGKIRSLRKSSRRWLYNTYTRLAEHPNNPVPCRQRWFVDRTNNDNTRRIQPQNRWNTFRMFCVPTVRFRSIGA